MAHVPTRFSQPPDRFPVTCWTLVEAAYRSDSDEEKLEAHQSLWLSYWFPLYSWARRSGWTEEDARRMIASQSELDAFLEEGVPPGA